jgi:hypothetical protein
MLMLVKSTVRTSSICEIVKKEKEIGASFAVTPQSVKAMTRMNYKCLVNIEEALNLKVEDVNRKHAVIEVKALS